MEVRKCPQGGGVFGQRFSPRFCRAKPAKSAASCTLSAAAPRIRLYRPAPAPRFPETFRLTLASLPIGPRDSRQLPGWIRVDAPLSPDVFSTFLVLSERFPEHSRSCPHHGGSRERLQKGRKCEGKAGCPDDVRTTMRTSCRRMSSMDIQERLNHQNNWVEYITFSPDGQFIATCSANTINLWKLSKTDISTTCNAQLYWSITLKENSWKCAFHPRDKILYAAVGKGGLIALDITNKKKIFKHKVLKENECFGIAVHPTLDILAVSGMDQSIKLLESNQGFTFKELSAHKNSIEDVKFSPDGLKMASCSKDGTCQLWKIEESGGKWTYHVQLEGHRNWVLCCQFCMEGLLVTTSADKRVGVWNTSSGVHLKWLCGHQNVVWDCCLLMDSKIMTCSSDKTVRLWDVVSGKQLAKFDDVGSLQDGQAQLISCAYSRTLQLVAVGGFNNTAYLCALHPV